MKKSKHLFLAALMATATFATGVAQVDLGKDCGCPNVNQRGTPILLSSLADAAGNLTADNTLLTCDKLYVLDAKIYVPKNKTLTIKAGTLIKGRYASAIDANALIAERGGKIIAEGSECCQIVFTAEDDPMDGTYPILNRGKWGGIVMLGIARNNLITSNAYSGGYNGVGFIEGYTSAEPRNLYGAGDPLFPIANDNDNSGVLKYVSIRHAGANLGTGTANELNGLSLGSVGRGTKLEHIEIVSNDDDGIEFFGGSVDLKYAVALFGNDDMFDYDLGWNGRGQFWFGLQLDHTAMPGGDNGFETDGDDDRKGDAAGYMSHPYIYNATIIGDGFTGTVSGGPSGPAGIQAKERVEGEIYNSVFANFKTGLKLIKTQTNRTGINAYDNWIAGTLKIVNNTFIGMGTGTSFSVDATPATGTDLTKFNNDGNVTAATVSGFDFSFAMNTTTNAVTNNYDAVASFTGAVTTPPTDGFFTPANYRGAFKPGTTWLSECGRVALMQLTPNVLPCPTDLNSDGQTNGQDYLDLVGSFGTSCTNN
jgi:hypothetical protein